MEHINNKLKAVVEESMLTSAILTVYVNKTKYNCYHGRIDSKVLPNGVIVVSRMELYKETLNVFAR